MSFIHDNESHESMECPRSVWNDDIINDVNIMRE